MKSNHINGTTVSIITMTYRKFDGLERTIRSVSNQNYNNIEYIVSDDGSDSFSYSKIEELIHKYGINNYKLLHNESNIGTVANANRACRESNGTYIMFLSSGDIFTSSEIVSEVVKRFINNDSDMICVRRIAYSSKPEYFLPHICSIPIINSYVDREKQYKAFITTHFWDMASGSATYYSKRILEKMNYFDTKYYLWEDGPFLERFLRESKLDYEFDLVAVWYELGGVSTGKANPLLEKDRLTFDKTDRVFFNNKLDWFTNQYIEYINKRSECNDKRSLNKLRLKYPIVMISHIRYKVMNKIFMIIDKMYLKYNKNWKRQLIEQTEVTE